MLPSILALCGVLCLISLGFGYLAGKKGDEAILPAVLLGLVALAVLMIAIINMVHANWPKPPVAPEPPVMIQK